MDFLIKRRITILMIFIAATFLGVISYYQLQLELLPNSESASVTVRINCNSDADPVYIEKEAVLAVEGAIKTVEGIDNIMTNVSSGGANIRVYFKENVNIKYATYRLQNKIRSTAYTLPTGFKVSLAKDTSDKIRDNFK